MTSLLIIFGCIFLSAFFSASETAITSLGSMKVKHLMHQRKGSIPYLRFWLEQPARVLTTILVFNNVVNIFASAVATEYAYQRFQSGAVGIATGAITLLVLVFGEIIPKSFAKIHCERLAPAALRVLRFIYYAAYPVVRAMSLFADGVIYLVARGRRNKPEITEEELEFIVNEGRKAGVIGEMKKNIIVGAFDFDETKVREIMTPRTDIKALDLNAGLDKMIDKAIETGYSRLPVYRNHMDNILGIVLVKDLLRRISSNKPVRAKEVMREALFAPESKSIMDVFKDLKRTKSHLAIIIDEHGGTAGLVTMEDILEEFVGEIQDEYDIETANVLKIDANVFEVSGAMNLDDFKQQFSIEAREQANEDIDTVGGLVTQLVGQMPQVGQKVSYAHLDLEVHEVKQHRISVIKVVVNPIEASDP